MGPSPDQIRHDIDRTRAELVADANRIVDHTRPRNIAQRRVDRVRHRMSTLKERVMGTVPETASTLQDRTSGMASTVGERAQGAAELTEDGPQVHIGEVRLDPAGFRLGQVEQVVDEVEHVVARAVDVAQIVAVAVVGGQILALRPVVGDFMVVPLPDLGDLAVEPA